MSYAIAIDGPAGAGKSTIARRLAGRLSFVYIDTGAMYRAMGICFIDTGVDTDKEEAMENACRDVDIVITYEQGVQQVILNGVNVTGRLRTEEAGKMASKVAKCKAVRKKLVELQQKLAKSTNVIMDGRDIGTCVLPDATAKIYLTASVEARAERRYKELVEKGGNPNPEEIAKDIERRDYEDMNRANSPLCKAEDAVYLDTSDMNISQVVDEIIEIFRQKQ